MANSSGYDDAEIIHAAYAERVREAFKIFADNLGVGENEKLCRDRFLRSLEMVRRARDLALLAASAEGIDAAAPAEAPAVQHAEGGAEALSPEYQSFIDKALAGTRGTGSSTPRG